MLTYIKELQGVSAENADQVRYGIWSEYNKKGVAAPDVSSAHTVHVPI